MDKILFRKGDIILYDGIYGCASGFCEHQVWGIAGRRLPELGCGHLSEWRLVRRRVDKCW
ncbi:MAG: hypothetical protein HY698_13690 [Deltaproteobacteria bacterium]|nr:hypothetical protein [Deltaproteobacteria bacterium]